LKKETVDFKRARVISYTTTEDGAGGKPTTYEVLDDGRTLKISGNAWKKIPFPYSVTANTVLEFDFMSTVEPDGVILAIGLDEDNDYTGNSRNFQLYGTETLPEIYDDYKNYSGSDWKPYTITVGSKYQASVSYMTFICDDDANGAADCSFKNVKVYESQ